MAEDKYAKAKCFILSPAGYQEISYLELCRRRDIDPDYQSRKFIPLHGMLMEVTPEQYAEFYRIQNRQRYLDRRSAENGDIKIRENVAQSTLEETVAETKSVDEEE